MANKLVIIGASGLGTEACWVAQEMNANRPVWEIVGFVDDDPQRHGRRLVGIKVLDTPERAAKELRGEVFFHCAVGRNVDRERLVERAEALGWRPGTLVHPNTSIGPDVEIGEGSFIAHHVVLGPSARIGCHVIINTFVGVGHHSALEDYSQICPGARISGACRVGRGALLGSNAVINPEVKIGEQATIGAASLALRDVEAGVTVLGVPGKVVARRA